MCFDCQDRKKYDVSIRPCIHHVTVAECMQGVPDVLIRNKNVKFFHRHLETLPNCLRYLAVVDSWKICRERYWGGLLIIFYINSTMSLLLMSGLITASPRPPPPEESYVGCLKSAPRSFHDFPNLMTKGKGLEHRTNGRLNSFACGSAFSSLNLSCCISAALVLHLHRSACPFLAPSLESLPSFGTSTLSVIQMEKPFSPSISFLQ